MSRPDVQGYWEAMEQELDALVTKDSSAHECFTVNLGI
jgi:hypothetical protein